MLRAIYFTLVVVFYTVYSILLYVKILCIFAQNRYAYLYNVFT